MRKKTMLSPKQYAGTIGKPYTTVMTWLQNGLLTEAVKLETPTGHFWAIPEGTKPPDLKPGPKPKAEEPVAAKKTPAPRQKGAKSNA
jgi:hypothetical protein